MQDITSQFVNTNSKARNIRSVLTTDMNIKCPRRLGERNNQVTFSQSHSKYLTVGPNQRAIPPSEGPLSPTTHITSPSSNPHHWKTSARAQKCKTARQFEQALRDLAGELREKIERHFPQRSRLARTAEAGCEKTLGP